MPFEVYMAEPVDVQVPSIEAILERMRQLSSEEKRDLASRVLSDSKLEAFLEELDDNVMCERAVNEEPPEPFRPVESGLFLSSPQQ